MVIGYRQMRWFFATRRRSWLLLVLSVLLDVGLLLLLDSLIIPHCTSAQNRQCTCNTDYGTIIKEKLKDFKLLQFFEAGTLTRRSGLHFRRMTGRADGNSERMHHRRRGPAGLHARRSDRRAMGGGM